MRKNGLRRNKNNKYLCYYGKKKIRKSNICLIMRHNKKSYTKVCESKIENVKVDLFRFLDKSYSIEFKYFS